MMAVEELIVNMPLSRARNLIGIPRRTYYSRKRFRVRIVNANTRITDEIVIMIREICSERVTYGYRRIWAMLRNEGIYLNPKTVLSIMKKENLSLEPHRHLNRKGWKKLFHPLGPDQLWETDLTYIPTLNDGMTYLFNIKDCFTKEWVVYRIQLHSDNMNMEKGIYRGRVKRGGDFNLLQDLEVTAHGR